MSTELLTMYNMKLPVTLPKELFEMFQLWYCLEEGFVANRFPDTLSAFLFCVMTTCLLSVIQTILQKYNGNVDAYACNWYQATPSRPGYKAMDGHWFWCCSSGIETSVALSPDSAIHSKPLKSTILHYSGIKLICSSPSCK